MPPCFQEKEMNVKREKGLLISAIIFQAIALIGAIYLTINQYNLIAKLSVDISEDVDVVPMGIFIYVISLLVVYILAFLVLKGAKLQNIRVLSGIFIVVACVIQVIMPFVENYIIKQSAQESVDAAISHNILESLAETSIVPITMVAFGLFCMGCGCYYGLKDTANNN